MPVGIGFAPESLRAHFDKKLDRAEIDHYLKEKSSKQDTEMALR